MRVCTGNYLDRAIAAFFKTLSAAAPSAWVGDAPGEVARRERRNERRKEGGEGGWGYPISPRGHRKQQQEPLGFLSRFAFDLLDARLSDARS